MRISEDCRELIRCLPALLCDAGTPEDAAGEPHAITHAPEALRYAAMSRYANYQPEAIPDKNFRFFAPPKKGLL